ncbi:MAG: cytochrome c-type biosis protein CcmH [Solirubrobacteraceae bacterium]|nr:cytochrome c-type biosis protein CcmH [Solirubrobacteraceae bacterium]
MSRAALLLGLLLALLAPAGAALAAAPRASLVDIEDEVMCVTCKIPLSIAEGPQPDRERELIRGLIAQGRTKAQIKTELVATYGPNVLALPDSGGVGMTAYLVPLGRLALLAGGLAVLLPRWRRRAPAAAAEEAVAAPVSGADAERLDADLARYSA